ncbi:unnamed protein product [Adineta steineri]|uniref:Uncharacterized protein n=1 Tax=Adineta steineri TaxID=433720 RepID=A0A813PFZ6_9BILA|nr:unnamed protein product [Adineta steineri]
MLYVHATAQQQILEKVLTPPTNNILSCSSTSACNSNITSYSILTFNNYRNLNVIGIVKDEHHIYGSYDSNGTEITKCFGPGNFSNVVPGYKANLP